MNLDPSSLIKLNNILMPYGKYRGIPLIDLPEQYVLWTCENQIPIGELGELFNELYDIKVNGLEAMVKKFKNYPH